MYISQSSLHMESMPPEAFQGPKEAQVESLEKRLDLATHVPEFCISISQTQMLGRRIMFRLRGTLLDQHRIISLYRSHHRAQHN